MQPREIARRFTEDGWDKRDARALGEMLSNHFVDHDPVPGQSPGGDGYAQMAAAFFGAFPDLRVQNHDVIVEGDKAVARWTANGTHRGELMGIPATGKRVSLKGLDILRVANGKIVERWGEFDALGMMQQLGAIPSGR